MWGLIGKRKPITGMGWMELVMNEEQLAEWRKEIVTAMLTQGICVEQIIPDVMAAEEFISTGEIPKKWVKTNNQNADA